MIKAESHIPKLRFKGFDKEWQKKKLSQISSRVQEKNRDNRETETFTNSAERGIINQRDFFDKDISNEANLDNYYVVQPNDFVYNPRISNFAPVGPIKRNKLGRSGVMSPLYSVFRPNSHIINFDFLEHYFSTTNWHKFMFTHGDQGARSDRFAIGMATFQKMPICISESIEQTKIGDFFQKIDQVIELQQKVLKTAQDYKKSMLQKMFPQKGEKVPQVRFDGFSGDWEEFCLNNIGDSFNGLSGKIKEDFGFGFPFITYKNIFSNSGISSFDECELVNILPNENQSLVKRGDIFFTTSSETPEEVGFSSVLLVEPEINTYLNSFCFGVRVRNLNALAPEFAQYLFRSPSSRKTIEILAQGSTRFNISKTNFMKLIFIKADLKEQQKIGEFFQKLDQQIEQHKKKLESYQQLKKAMLQRMFI